MKSLKSIDHLQTLQQNEQLLTVQEICALISVTPRCLENWRKTGKGPRHIRISKRCVRYPIASLREWISSKQA